MKKIDLFYKIIDLNSPIQQIMLAKLTVHQLEVLDECLKKGSGGLSLPMGFGKTLISLVLTLQQQEKIGTPEPILVICSKTLIESWIFEIKKL